MSTLSLLKQYQAKKAATKSAIPATPIEPRGYFPDRIAALHASTIFIHFKEDRKILNVIKRIYNRTYNKAKGCWEAPLTLDAIAKLREGQFQIAKKILDWEAALFAPPVFNPNFDIPGLLHPEYIQEYQWEGAQHLEWWDGNALLADDQGLGKTLQIIMWWLHRSAIKEPVYPALIICPAIAKITWLSEIQFWMENPPTVQIISGNKPTEIWADIVIINYDILVQTKDGKDALRQDIWNVDWQFIGMDEAHYVCNTETMRGWAISNLVDRCPHVIPITATPSRHRPRDMFPLISMVDDRVFPSFYKYANRYCDPQKGFGGVTTYDGSSNEEELNDLLMKTVMIRRKKEDVFPQIKGQKIRQVIPFEIENRKTYDEAELDFEDFIMQGDFESKTNHIFAKMEKLRQLAVQGKLKACIEWIWNLLESEDKVVVFAEHKETLDALQKEFGDISVRVDGSNNNPKKREEARRSFQRCKRCGVLKERHANSPEACRSWIPDLTKRVFLASRAGITNITLTASYHVVFTELWPSPSDHDQGEDRAFGRAGDLHGAMCWYLVAYGTIEMKQARMYDLKNSRLTKVMDGKVLDEKMMLTQLLNEYRRKS